MDTLQRRIASRQRRLPVLRGDRRQGDGLWEKSRATLGLPRSAERNYIKAFAPVIAGALALAGCTSGIKLADEACSQSRVAVAAFADCLRSNYTTLTSGPPDQSDLGALYLAAAEYQATKVANGRISDAEAMLELAAFRTSVLAPMEQKRRDAAVQKAMQAIQSAARSGSQGRGGSGTQAGQSAYAGQRGSHYAAPSPFSE